MEIGKKQTNTKGISLPALEVSRLSRLRATKLMLSGVSWPQGCYKFVRLMFADCGVTLPDVIYTGTAEDAIAGLDKLSSLYEYVEKPEPGDVIIGKCPLTNRRHLYWVEDAHTVTHMFDDGKTRLGVLRQKLSEIEINKVLRYVGD